MADLHLRDIPEDLADRLKRRADQHGRTREDEAREILEQSLKPPGSPDFWERAAELRARLKGRVSGDSADLIREDRDSR